MKSGPARRHRRAILRGVVAERDDVVELAGHIIELFRPPCADVNAALPHGLDGQRMDALGIRLRAGAGRLHARRSQRARKALGHLAARRIAGADEQDARGHGCALPGPSRAAPAAASTLPCAFISLQTRSKDSSAAWSKSTK